jgi:hypothetical protein
MQCFQKQTVSGPDKHIVMMRAQRNATAEDQPAWNPTAEGYCAENIRCSVEEHLEMGGGKFF